MRDQNSPLSTQRTLLDEATSTLFALSFIGFDVEPWLDYDCGGALPRTGCWSTVTAVEKQEIATRLARA